ncbi:ATP-binding cassette domain-containing protein (plasmid) [Erwinia sp. E602]|uniref:ABC transporter ATP-binding protein n=1 Tax=Erwinia sp. E602 TaxID=2675378 RepID=UPI001BA4E17F|nr:ABC transporter ATP-binding protein [Erwinia sp. E602]QUG73694.1 ATP-binding cassette domain-containing protein [Erwinia sp. E602]
MPSIQLSNLSKRYPGSETPAVNNVSLTVKDGEFLCLLGPSGCGKTTILRMIAGIEHASGGEITIGDRLVDSVARGTYLPPEKRGIGLVFQSYALWPHMTVEQNVDFGLRLQKLPARERSARCQDVMEKLRIADYARRYPAQLSGGQQQRVALARMLAVNPGVLLLDEPLSNLDATLRLEMRAELKRLHATFGTTIVFVSHDQWEAMTLATTIAVMSAGEMQQVGTPDAIYARPANRFVAEFIGTPKLNMIPLHQPVSLLSEHLQQRYPSVNGEACVCGIRPEEIVLHERPYPHSVAMTLDNIMPTGGSWVIELVNGHDRLFHSTQLRPRWQAGQQVYCQLPADALHFFTPAGQRHEPAAAADFSLFTQEAG